MNCPSCKTTTLLLSERKGIEIDYCPDCRGVWLDRGELDKILENARTESGAMEREREEERRRSEERRYEDRKYEDRKYEYRKPYRKKSLLEELFD